MWYYFCGYLADFCRHSSSSAIFERDIEQPSMHHAMRDPHHTSRAMSHELDAAVPSVLSAAISALNVGSEDDVSVIAPAHMPMSRLTPSELYIILLIINY